MEKRLRTKGLKAASNICKADMTQLGQIWGLSSIFTNGRALARPHRIPFFSGFISLFYSAWDTSYDLDTWQVVISSIVTSRELCGRSSKKKDLLEPKKFSIAPISLQSSACFSGNCIQDAMSYFLMAWRHLSQLPFSDIFKARLRIFRISLIVECENQLHCIIPHSILLV